MPQKCIVNNCKSGYDSSKEKLHFFYVPKDAYKRKLWAKAINRPNFNIKARQAVCEKHFKPEDIKWQNEIKEKMGLFLE